VKSNRKQTDVPEMTADVQTGFGLVQLYFISISSCSASTDNFLCNSIYLFHWIIWRCVKVKIRKPCWKELKKANFTAK